MNRNFETWAKYFGFKLSFRHFYELINREVIPSAAVENILEAFKVVQLVRSLRGDFQQTVKGSVLQFGMSRQYGDEVFSKASLPRVLSGHHLRLLNRSSATLTAAFIACLSRARATRLLGSQRSDWRLFGFRVEPAFPNASAGRREF